MNVLLTSAGRRVTLLRSFRRALAASGGRVFAADADTTAPTLWEADGWFRVDDVMSASYVDELVQICDEQDIRLLIPLIDPELSVLAVNRAKLHTVGTIPMVGEPWAVDVAQDKLRTAQFFDENGVPTPRTWTLDEFLSEVKGVNYPVVVKSRVGSAGASVRICLNAEEVEFFAHRTEKPLVQEYVRGTEVTIDILGDGSGQLIAMVPRKRLKIRGGEVERGVTVEWQPFLPHVERFCAAYRPFGVINLQCIVTSHGPRFTEVNARFGGGYPLSDAAGARFPELLLDLVSGRRPQPCVGCYRVGLVMSRYDDAVFVPSERLPGGDAIRALPILGDQYQ